MNSVKPIWTRKWVELFLIFNIFYFDIGYSLAWLTCWSQLKSTCTLNIYFEKNFYLERKISRTQKHWWLIKNGFFFTFRGDDVTDDEYNEFYKSISKDSDLPLAKTHFTAEGEVTFKSILYVPKTSPHDMFSNYGKKLDAIKVR